MSGKLDQSLDQIMHDGGSTARRGKGRPRQSGRRAAQKAKAAIAAPAGGVQKNTKASANTAKTATMAAPKAPAPARGSSKVLISGLPEDVKEKDLKDYITQVVGPCRSVIISYGPNGRSRGMATVTFNNPASPAKAVQSVNGIKIDGRLVKVEVVYDGSAVPAPAPVKSLAERTSKPKSAAKEVKAAPKAKGAAPATNGTTATKGAKGKKAGRASRPKKKTADELDAEMQDYFGGHSAPANGTAQPAAATNGAEPVDQVM